MGLKVIAAPTSEQISMTLARLHLRLDDDGDSPAAHPDDQWLSEIGIPGSREFCEKWTQRALGTQTLELALDEFPVAEIELPMSPIVSITSVKYVDGDGVEQTLASSNYAFDNYQEPGWLLPAYGVTWPSTRAVINAVKVRYVAGYSLPTETQTNPLPASIKAAMLLMLGLYFDNRANAVEIKQEEIPLGAASLLLPYRLRLSMA